MAADNATLTKTIEALLTSSTTSSTTAASVQQESRGPSAACPTEVRYADPTICPSVYDGFMCWPATSAGHKVVLPCPKGIPGLLENNFVTRQCLSTGRWFSCKPQADPSNQTVTFLDSDTGWTNFSSCLTESTRKLMKDLNYEAGCPKEHPSDESENKILIAKFSRVLEVMGYSLSFLVLFFALITFCYFRKLRKHKVTRIHMNLFASMILQSFIRLIIYIDQFVVREDGFTFTASANVSTKGIDNTPFLCQTFYTLIEYGKTAMFLWMFIEGIILYHMTTVAYSRGPANQNIFYFCVIPIPLTLIWALTAFDGGDSSHCGQGYSLQPSYWIIEGPRVFFIVLNVFILLNVSRVLFMHLQGNEESTDVTQIRKSLKSLLFLLPLLGITNVLHHLWPHPLRGSWISFAIWSITTHFLYSFQGLFVACAYFLFDKKVKTTFYTFWILKVTLRDRTGSNSAMGIDRRQNFSEGHPAITPGSAHGGGGVAGHVNGHSTRHINPDRKTTDIDAIPITNSRRNSRKIKDIGKPSPKRKATILRNVETKMKKKSSITTLKPPARMLSSFRV
eukprot:maker-scaffold387_size188669-snap-gene-0.20 protein:Tk03874 transcript:maker-scaffold387_size188669-snap-gene-0.20-mRNA-1 annotation:"pigment dispersing hormone receptor"